jgi:hypothetical protein
MYKLLLFCAGTALLVSLRLPAHAVEMQPGLWELTTTLDDYGTVSKHPPHRHCVTAEDAKAASSRSDDAIGDMLKGKLGADDIHKLCKVTEAKNISGLARWRVLCAGTPDLEQVVTARFDGPRHYTLVIKTSMTARNRTFTSTRTTEGYYKGECQR